MRLFALFLLLASTAQAAISVEPSGTVAPGTQIRLTVAPTPPGAWYVLLCNAAQDCAAGKEMVAYVPPFPATRMLAGPVTPGAYRYVAVASYSATAKVLGEAALMVAGASPFRPTVSPTGNVVVGASVTASWNFDPAAYARDLNSGPLWFNVVALGPAGERLYVVETHARSSRTEPAGSFNFTAPNETGTYAVETAASGTWRYESRNGLGRSATFTVADGTAPKTAVVVDAGADKDSATKTFTLTGKVTSPRYAKPIIAARWIQRIGPPAKVARPTSLATSVSVLGPGTYTFTLTAEAHQANRIDAGNAAAIFLAEGSDDVTVTVP